ncbi:MAG: HesA/MoeB/ThiF family protein [Clostridiales bacterium]|nr:HesA/MoeB/ThiF family protein [Clostridiales bacterium]
MENLSSWQREIYARNIALAEVGEAGQQKLLEASVLVVGCGGLGSSALLYLAAMGIGRIGLCDGDKVAPSNFNRQILYAQVDLGRLKVEATAQRLLQLRPDLRIDLYPDFFTRENGAAIAGKNYQIVLDCLDNLPSRFILNDICLELGLPFVYAGVYKFFGQSMTIIPGQGPCLRCLFPSEEAALQRTANTVKEGMLGITPGIFGTLQALEACKYLLGLPVNSNSLLFLNGLEMAIDKHKIEPRPDCRCQVKVRN